MPENYSFEKQWEADQDRFDWRQAVSEYVSAPGGGGTVTRVVSATITWGITFSEGISFESVNAAVGGSYSEAKTFGDNYTMNLLGEEKARIIYVPKIHFMNGWLTKTTGGDIIPVPSGNPPIPTPVTTEIDHQWIQIHFPVDGGTFELEYDVPTFYTDSWYKGQAIRLTKGVYDWGSIPNDAISSLRVPENYTVALFKDTHFKGESKVFGQGDYPYVGDDFNDQTSSINIW